MGLMDTPMLARGRYVTLARTESVERICNLGHKHRVVETAETVDVWLPTMDAMRGRALDGRVFSQHQ